MTTHLPRQCSMSTSPHLDIFTIEPESINPELPICTGYLDNTLAVFERHKHPFVLVSTLAMTWSGSNNLAQDEIDILVRSSQLQDIVNDLVALGEWKTSNTYANKDDYGSIINQTAIPDIWLKSCIEDPWFSYLRLWPEELYKLSVECNNVEVPDVLNIDTVLLEEEYYRDPYERFGPPRLSKKSRSLLPRLQMRAKLLRRDIPIFIPTIEEHLNALLDQRREELHSGLRTGGDPEWQIKNFIRYLYLDWPPNREWILNAKVQERNRELMSQRLDRFKRKLLILWDSVLKRSVFDKMPWDLSIRPGFQQA